MYKYNSDLERDKGTDIHLLSNTALGYIPVLVKLETFHFWSCCRADVMAFLRIVLDCRRQFL